MGVKQAQMDLRHLLTPTLTLPLKAGGNDTPHLCRSQ